MERQEEPRLLAIEEGIPLLAMAQAVAELLEREFDATVISLGVTGTSAELEVSIPVAALTMRAGG
jgi:hypothetical protein